MTSSVTIICPKCQAEIPVEEAFSHKLQERLEREYQGKLAQSQKQLENEAMAKAEEKARQKLELQIKDKANEAEELRKQNKEMQAQMLELTKLVRELRKSMEDKDLEYQKRLTSAQEKISEETRKKADEEYRLKELEYQKKLADAIAAKDELSRKLEQGSQQTQGEVQELLLEDLLRGQFPQDEVAPVAKGARGADVIQKVFDKTGQECGTILWESKQTKAWSDGWVIKLKEDQRSIGADLAIIISSVLPSKVHRSGYHQGIWVTDLDGIIGLCWSLRYHLIQAHGIRQQAAATEEKKDELFKYVTGRQFQHRVEAMNDAYKLLFDDIEKERRWFTTKWARQEKSIRTLMEQTGSIHGELSGIVGPALPPVKSLELDGGDNQEKLLAEN